MNIGNVEATYYLPQCVDLSFVYDFNNYHPNGLLCLEGAWFTTDSFGGNVEEAENNNFCIADNANDLGKFQKKKIEKKGFFSVWNFMKINIFRRNFFKKHIYGF